MSQRPLTISLLVIYSAAILGFCTWEVGHSVLHAFKNSVHHHTHDHLHGASDHQVISAADDPSSANPNAVLHFYGYFLFFEVCNLMLNHVNFLRQKLAQPEPKLLSAIDSFFAPPPKIYTAIL